MQPSAARVPEAKYEAIQNFITDSPWDWGATQSNLIREMREKVSGSRGLLVIDDTPLPKQGGKSPGVSKQYSGLRGSVDNCQALVDCVYVLPGGEVYREAVAWGLAMDLYLPRSWTEDPGRCEEAGVPTPAVFREKWRIALEQVDRARAQRLPHQAVLGDCGYGDGQEFRRELRKRGEPYVMEVTASEVRVVPSTTRVLRPEDILGKGGPGHPRTLPRFVPGTKGVSPKTLAEEANDWVRIRWAEGTKGPLEGEFTRRKVRVCRTAEFPTDEVGWLLLEKTSEGLKSWICWGLSSLSLEELALMAHRRFLIERFHEEAKMELGLDHFEGRRWRGLNHHVTLVLLAHAYLTLEQLRVQEEGKGEPLPTLAAMRRQVVIEVAMAMVARVALDPTKRERMDWATAVAHYWAGAG